MRRTHILASVISVASVALLAFLAGCAGSPSVTARITDDFFFPAPPDLPLVQFVRSFNGSVDFKERRPWLEYLAGAEDLSEYEVEKPFSVAASRGRIYVTDSFGLQGLNVFDLEHRRFYVIGREPGPGQLRKPIHVFVDEARFKYVADLQRRQVMVYGPDDAFVRAYGDGNSFVPVACAAHGKEVFVLDIAKDKLNPEEPGAEPEEVEEVRRDQVLVLDKETGKPLRRIGRHGSDHEGFAFAGFMTVDRLGNLYISDFLNHRVVKMDSQGNVFAAFGRHGDRAGDFAQMKGLAVDRTGLIYVVDAAFQMVQAFDNAGAPLFVLGGPRAPQGPMNLPAGIWIDRDNVEYFRDLYAPDFTPEYLVLVANQLSPRHKIAVYAYGKRKGVEYPPADQITTLEKAQRKVLWQMPVFPPDSPQGAPPPASASKEGNATAVSR